MVIYLKPVNPDVGSPTPTTVTVPAIKNVTCFGDCCLDYFAQCARHNSDFVTVIDQGGGTVVSQSSPPNDAFEDITINLGLINDIKGKQRCFHTAIRMESLPSRIVNLEMVAECLAEGNEEESFKCNGEAGIGVEKDIPVYDNINNMLYKNIFCARCHKREEINLEFFEIGTKL